MQHPFSTDNQKTDQLKVIQAFDFVGKKTDLTATQKAVDVAFLFDLDDGGYGITKEAGKLMHVSAVAGFFIECAVELCNRLRLAFAEVTHFVQHILRGEVVADYLSIVCEVDHIERMEPVLIVEVHAVGPVL